MQFQKRVELSFLALLLLVLGSLASTRWLQPRLGAAPATLDSPFSKEEAWIVDEIVRDITEMSAYPAKQAAAPVVTAENGVYEVRPGGAASAPVAVDLRQDVWSPAQFSTLARAVLTATGGAVDRVRDRRIDVHQQLLNLTPGSIVTGAAIVSQALAADMHAAAAHESAALVVAGFALRESAGRFNDTRWAMNRVTAHLAMAAALRGETPISVDGRLADVVLSILTQHQTRALDELNAFDRQTAAVQSWTRALRLRITGDLRVVDDLPHRTRLEQLEYFRVARKAAPRSTGRAIADRIGLARPADWFRIVEAAGAGVEDAEAIDEALAGERAESAEVWQRLNGRPADDWFEALNARATRAVADGRPQVLPWGAWAEFAQRHIALFVDKQDMFYRYMLGNEHAADARKLQLARELGRLRLFPIATMFWNKGPKGSDGDATFINEAIAVAVAAPELVQPAPWARLALGSHYEVVRRGMPEPNSWFAPTAPRFGYEAARRIQEGGASASPETMAALLVESPYDDALATRYLSAKYGKRAPSAELKRAYGPRLDYDVHAIRAARTLIETDDPESLRLARVACALSAPDCLALASLLADADHAGEAADCYERAFADPALDAVALATYSGWLVDYYYHHGRTASAIALAERSAETGAFRGLVTMAHLYERLGRADDAERTYREAATHYDSWPPLVGFYYRAVQVRHQIQFDRAWQIALARVFPHGLTPVTTSDARPESGVVVTSDSARSRKAGLQAGDVVVGLEGWAVSNYDQYATINAFFDDTHVKLTAWRGHLFTVESDAPNRLLGVEYRSYPVRGWAEK